jgi:Tol biopolymer transport system component
MTSDRRFEQDLPTLLAQLAPRATPQYRDDIVRQTARVRQRPAWTFLERWLPMDLTLDPVRGRGRPLATLAVLLIIGLLVAGTLAAYVGSRAPRLPAPFGPADNGALYTSTNGDVYVIDSITATPRLIVAGSDFDQYPLPSRDGRHISFERTVAGGARMVVADENGTNERVLAGTYTEVAEVDWAPTGQQVAIISRIGGVPALSILEVDGSKATAIDLGMEPQSFWYLPNGQIAFKGRQRGAAGSTYGLYVVALDGTDPKLILPLSTDVGRWMDPSPSPDGTKLVYHRWTDPGPHGQLGIVDIKTGDDRPLVPTNAAPEEEHEGAQFSPDGASVMFSRFTADRSTLSVVPVNGGAAIDIGEDDFGNQMPIAAFSPDGLSVIAYYRHDGTLWLLDPTGARPDQKLDLPVSDAPTWQRIAR